MNRCRLSLVDYGGVLLDRIEQPLPPEPFAKHAPDGFLSERVQALMARSPALAARLASVAICVQGALSVDRQGLSWSPIRGLAGHALVAPMSQTLAVPVTLYKRGRLMADGTPWLFPAMAGRNCASIFLGTTVGMGLALPDERRTPADIGTEFGHMVHIPDGALCRCGSRGCVEAYLADYGVLRTSFGLPERTPPAQSVRIADFEQVVAQAERGERNARRAFTLAGEALGASISRVMALVELSHLVLMGPGTMAFPLMHPAFEEAVRASLPGRIGGVPEIVLTRDAGEPIFRGLLINALTRLDSERLAALPAGARWAETWARRIEGTEGG